MILCVGHSTLDTFLVVHDAELHCDINHNNCKVCFNFGDKIPVSNVHYSVGGGAANVTVGLSRLGNKVSIYSVVGRDPKGKDIQNALKEEGIDISHLEEDTNSTDQSAIINYAGERTIFSYNHQRKYSLPSDAEKYSHIFLSSVGSDVTALYSEIIQLKLKNPNLVLFYNPGSRELRNAHEDILNLLPSVDYMIANVDEGCTVLSKTLERTQIEIKDLLKLLVEKTEVKNVVLTDGGNGVHAIFDGEVMDVTAEKVEVVEKTGAGDAFSSGLISGIVDGRDVAQAVKWGMRNASSVIQQFGAQTGLLTGSDLVEGDSL